MSQKTGIFGSIFAIFLNFNSDHFKTLFRTGWLDFWIHEEGALIKSSGNTKIGTIVFDVLYQYIWWSLQKFYATQSFFTYGNTVALKLCAHVTEGVASAQLSTGQCDWNFGYVTKKILLILMCCINISIVKSTRSISQIYTSFFFFFNYTPPVFMKNPGYHQKFFKSTCKCSKIPLILVV